MNVGGWIRCEMPLESGLGPLMYASYTGYESYDMTYLICLTRALIRWSFGIQLRLLSVFDFDIWGDLVPSRTA